MTPLVPLLTTAEVAERLRVHRATVGRWVREGKLQAIELPGGTKRYRESDIDRLMGKEDAA